MGMQYLFLKIGEIDISFKKTVAKPKRLDTFFTPAKKVQVTRKKSKPNPNIIRLNELNKYIAEKQKDQSVDYYGKFFFHRTDKDALEGILQSGFLEARLGEFTFSMLPDLLNEDNVPPALLARWEKYSGRDPEGEFDWDELQEIVDIMKDKYPENFAELIYGRKGVYAEIAPYAFGGDAEGWDIMIVIDNRDEGLVNQVTYDDLNPDSVVFAQDIPLDRLSLITYDKETKKVTSIIPLKSRIGD